MPLVATLVAALGVAFVLGTLAHRLRASPLVGYILAGIFIGPFTPGFVADRGLATQLAEIGIILLMFGVGLHFSLKDLLSVRAIALPGAAIQVAVATLLGMGLARAMGWSSGAGLVFGLALSAASTVVLLRALQGRRLLETERGKIAVGWLIVEDLAMVLTLVLLPAVAGLLDESRSAPVIDKRDLALALAVTLGKVAAFVVLMLVVGRRLIPLLLHYVAHTGSRELFRLAVLTVALGVAFGAAELFGVSFALGAFFAGMVLSESELSQQAAAESLPLRDAFAVLFFVSVGMLFDPTIILREPWPALATLLIIVLGNSLASFLVVLGFRHPLPTAALIGVSLAQIGEFSFILAGLGVATGLLPSEGRDLILAGAIISIILNPFLFAALDHFTHRLERRREAAAEPVAPPREEIVPTSLANHTVLVGFGRVGRFVGEGLDRVGRPYFVIEDNAERVAALVARGVEAIEGNAADPEILRAANLAAARFLLVAIPNGFEAGQIVEQGRAANPGLVIVARAHFEAELDHLRTHGADLIIMGEREIARGMLDHVLADHHEPAGSLP
jgi:CPA2 family monovalent cation:H+ antiporter-2